MAAEGNGMKRRIPEKKTPMLKRYLLTFFFRLAIFVIVFILYLTDRGRLTELMSQPIVNGVTIIHVLWVIFMIMMLTHIFPSNRLSMAIKKADHVNYDPQPYEEVELYRFVKEQNIRAWTVLLVWLCFNAIFGFLYLIRVLKDIDLLMLTVFYFLSDYICIMFYCPFQFKIMKNRCCVNCRIYDWGHFMIFTPMLFIRNFFSWSLFFTSCVVLIRWELYYARHPERFWFGSNRNLNCANCRDRICRYKGKCIS